MKKILNILILTIIIFAMFTGCETNSSSYDLKYETSDGIDEVETSPYLKYSITDSGYCGAYGENVVWNYYEEINAIEFIGNGEIKDYSYYDESNDIPWYHYRQLIEQVYISECITRIGSRDFEGFESITEITIPNSVESIGSYEFWGCDNLKDVYLSKNILEISDCAFGYCQNLESIHYSGTSDEWDSINIADDAFSNNPQKITLYYE